MVPQGVHYNLKLKSELESFYSTIFQPCHSERKFLCWKRSLLCLPWAVCGGCTSSPKNEEEMWTLGVCTGKSFTRTRRSQLYWYCFSQRNTGRKVCWKKIFNNCFWLDITSQSWITKLLSFYMRKVLFIQRCRVLPGDSPRQSMKLKHFAFSVFDLHGSSLPSPLFHISSPPHPSFFIQRGILRTLLYFLPTIYSQEGIHHAIGTHVWNWPIIYFFSCFCLLVFNVSFFVCLLAFLLFLVALGTKLKLSWKLDKCWTANLYFFGVCLLQFKPS